MSGFSYFWKKYDGRGRCCCRCGRFQAFGWRALGFPKKSMPFVCIGCSPNKPEE